MLDSIARASQEKLKRERAEHSRYEDVLQSQLRASMDENASLVTVLTQQDAVWEQRLQQQQSDEGSYKNAYYSTSPMPAESPLDGVYYRSYDDAHGADMASIEHYPSHYSTDEPGTLTPTEEKQSEDHYPSEHADRSDRPGNNSPPISPTKVGAVWNKFFENVAMATERTRDDSSAPLHAPRGDNNPSTKQSMQLRPQVAHPSAMFMAIRKSDLAQLQKLLLSGLSPNVRDDGEKGTPLHLACELGDLDAVQMLCEFAADVEVRDEAENTPLLVACSQGHYPCVVFLLQSAADPTTVNASGESALHLAAWDGSAPCIAILCEYGVDPLATNALGLSPLANLKTRSPLRHKFGDLVPNHPMRQALDLLDEMTRSASISAGSERGAVREKDNSPAKPEQRKRRNDSGSPTKHVTFTAKEPRANQRPGSGDESDNRDASKSAASWTDWLFAFSRAANAKSGGERADAERKGAGGGVSDHDDNAARDDHESDDSDNSSGDSSPALDPALLRSLLHEPLEPPPEIAAELRRAKSQLHRPATAATGGDGIADSDGRVTASTSTSGANAAHQNFVAADRARLSSGAASAIAAASSSKGAAAATSVRARYVDTFNA